MAGNAAIAAADAAAMATLVAGERETLNAFLDYQRVSVAERARGLSEADARARRVPSETTIGGVVKHLWWVEINWFQRVLALRPDDDLPAKPYSAADPDGDFRMDDDETLPALIARYEDECARSRETAAAYELDVAVTHDRLGPITLRWVLVHMIEETARHAGQLDILREQTDGLRGED